VHDVCRPKYHERSSLISVIADDFCDALLEQHVLVDARLTSRVLGRHGAARPVAKLKKETKQRAKEHANRTHKCEFGTLSTLMRVGVTTVAHNWRKK
jgi:hypothetical protein